MVAPVAQMVVAPDVVTIPHHPHAQLVAMAVELLVATILLLLHAQHAETVVGQHVAIILPIHVLVVRPNAPRNARVSLRRHVQIAQLDVVPVVATIVTTAVVDYAEESAGHRVVVHVKENVEMVVAKWSVSDMAS